MRDGIIASINHTKFYFLRSNFAPEPVIGVRWKTLRETPRLLNVRKDVVGYDDDAWSIRTYILNGNKFCVGDSKNKVMKKMIRTFEFRLIFRCPIKLFVTCKLKMYFWTVFVSSTAHSQQQEESSPLRLFTFFQALQTQLIKAILETEAKEERKICKNM